MLTTYLAGDCLASNPWLQMFSHPTLQIRSCVTLCYRDTRIKITKILFENGSQFRYLGTTVTNQNLIQKGIKRRLSYGMLATIQSKTFCLPFCYQRMRMYKTIILPVILYGCKNWSLTLREEHGLRSFENRGLRIFGPKAMK
jgi:hypothetical protein